MEQLTATIERWLDGELDRMWLIAERRMRRCEAAGATVPDPRGLRAVLDARRLHRGGGAVADLGELDRALAACEERLASLRTDAPIGHLARRLRLRAIELDVIVAVLAPLIDPPLAALYTLGRSARGVDLALIGELFDLGRRGRLELLQVLDADRPLLAWNLVVFEGPARSPVERPLAIAADIVALLSGTRMLTPSLVPHARLRSGRADLEGLVLDDATAARLDALRTGFTTADPALPWLVLHGPAGSGRRELATRLAASARRLALVFDPGTCTPETLGARLRMAEREALIRSAVLVIGPIAAERAAAFAHELRRYPDLVMFVVDGSESPALDTDRAVHAVMLGTLAAAQARGVWHAALATVPHGPLDLDPLVDEFRLTPGDILAAVGLADAAARAEARAISAADLRAGIAMRLRRVVSADRAGERSTSGPLFESELAVL